MTFEDKRRRALAMLKRKGVGGWTAAPPACRLLWRLGVRVPPPHFASTAVNAAVLTVMILPITLVVFTLNASPWGEALWELASGTVLAGVGAALAYRKEAEQHGLPSWLDLEHDEPRPSGSILGLPPR